MLVSSALAVTTWGSDRLDVSGIAPDGSIWHKGGTGIPWMTGPWEGLGSPRLPFTGMSAVSWGPNRLDVFAVGTNGATYHKWGTPPTAWASAWDNLGGVLTNPPAVVAWGPDRLDAFGIGAGGGVWHIFWNPETQWSQWNTPSITADLQAPPGVIFMGALSAVSWAPGDLEVFAVGSDGGIWHKNGNGVTWESAWDKLGAPPGLTFTSAPSAVCWGPNRVDVFAIASDGAMYHNYWNATYASNWPGWEPLGGGFLSAPSVTSWGPNRLDLFGIGLDGGLWHNSWNGSAWEGWKDDLGAPTGITFAGAPSAVSSLGNRVDVCALGTDGRTYHKAFTNGVWQANWDDLDGQLITQELPQNIGLKMQYQEASLWCWIAVATSINHFYNPASAATQCAIMTSVGLAKNNWPVGTQCCPSAAALASVAGLAEAMTDPYTAVAEYVLDNPAVGMPAVCNKSGGVNDALNVYSNVSNYQGQPSISLAQIVAELGSGQPIVVDINWIGGGQHCVAIVGVLNNLLLISDPIFGESVIQYGNFPGQYQGGATVNSYFLTKSGS